MEIGHQPDTPMDSRLSDADVASDVFVARQPILDRSMRLAAYELLFRAGPENRFTGGDLDVISSQCLSHAVEVLGLDVLAEGVPAYLNFPRNALVDGVASLLPPRRVVIEILEHVPDDDDVVQACKVLKRQGYRLALDDYVPGDHRDRLLALVNCIKVDVRGVPVADWDSFTQSLKRPGRALLAEKVETAEEVEHARRLGYDLFQGFFFARPTVMKGRDVPAIRQNYLRLLQALASPDVTIPQLEALIKPELSIAYRLLRHVNSAAFGLRREVVSVAQALVLIGSDDVRKWASVWSLAELGKDKPDALILLAATRGRFCELLGHTAGLGSACSELFLMGMFSLLDAIVDRPIEQALAGLALPDTVRTAIVDRTGVYSPYLETALAYERGDWDGLARSLPPLAITPTAVRSAYLAAATWAQQMSAGAAKR